MHETNTNGTKNKKHTNDTKSKKRKRGAADPAGLNIAIKLSGGPDAWAALSADEQAARLDDVQKALNRPGTDVEQVIKNLNDAMAQDLEKAGQDFINHVSQGAKQELNNMMRAAFDAMARSDVTKTLNSILDAASLLGNVAPIYKQLVEDRPEYAPLREAGADVTRQPTGERDTPENRALWELYCKAWAEAQKIYEAGEQFGPLENIQGRRLKQWINPTDKATALFFSAAVPRPEDLPGQMSFVPETLNYDNSIPINMGKAGKTKDGKDPKQAILFLSYRTDPGTMQEFNKNWGDEYAGNFFLTFAASNLFLAADPKPGQHVKISLRQLFRAMPGKTSEPNEKQLQKLLNNVLQCLGTMVYTNTRQIAEQWNFQEYDEQYGQILPGKWVNKRATINGAVVDSYLELYDVSPFLRLALDMKQVQPVNIKVLEIKLSRTESTYRVFYYLLREILWMQAKNSRRTPLITYSDLYAAVGATDKKRRFSARNTCFKILDQWREIGFIAGYRETPKTQTPGIEIDSRNTLTD